MKPDKDRDKSGYENAVLLELRIARWCAWLLWLALTALVITTLLAPHLFPWWGALWAAVLLAFTARWSSKAEYRAEEQLKEIWQADGLDRLVNG